MWCSRPSLGLDPPDVPPDTGRKEDAVVGTRGDTQEDQHVDGEGREHKNVMVAKERDDATGRRQLDPTMISSRITVITERYRMSSSVKMMTTVTAVILRIDLLPACCMSEASGAAPAT